MNENIEKIRGFRIYLLRQIEALTDQQLNQIPQPYNNNIIWNLAHLMAVQQNLCYARSGLPITIEDSYFSSYLPGTKPQMFVNGEDIHTIKEKFITTIDRLNIDYNMNLFEHYSPAVRIPEIYGFAVDGINVAIDFLLYHEGLHTGQILSLKRSIQ